MMDPDRSYLGLLKLCLVGLGVALPHSANWPPGEEVVIEPLAPSDAAQRRAFGTDWPVEGFTMIGIERLSNVQACIEDTIRQGVPGDFIETGVWRGGTTILMRALLEVHAVRDRIVFVADSFAGLPPPDPSYPHDQGSELHTAPYLAVWIDQVRSYFEKFGLLDDQVQFLQGWFRDTLPTLSDRTWAVIRLDGDLYESTTNGLENLYPNLSSGGYAIIDDYHLSPPCKEAVDDYRAKHDIQDEIREIGWSGVFWQKS
jgi:O-methyltransferase